MQCINGSGPLLASLKRVLTNRGILVLTTPNGRLRLKEGEKPWNPYHKREYGAEELATILKAYFCHVSVLGLFCVGRIQNLYMAMYSPFNTRFPFRTGYDIALRMLTKLDFFKVRQLLSKSSRDWFVKSFSKRSEARRCALSGRAGLRDFTIEPQNIEDALNIVAICKG